MENKTLGKYIAGFGVSLSFTIVLNVMLVILKGSKVIFDLMKSLTGHHWITHGIVVVVSFFLIGIILSSINIEKWIDSDLILVFIGMSILISILVLFGYYYSTLQFVNI